MNELADDRGEQLDLRATGERIEALLDASSSGGPVARERAEELVRLVVDLYGAGLERMLDVLYEADRLDDVALDALARDELVTSLLLVHGLHPETVGERVERALVEVRPYLGSHGGDVELLGVGDDGTVRLRLLGSCDGCASSAATLTLAVEGAIRALAPEATAIEVDSPPEHVESREATSDAFIPLASIQVRRAVAAGEDAPRWHAVPDLCDLAPGQVRTAVVGDVALVVCRVAGDLFAFRDGCASCGESLGAARLERRLGGAVGDGVLRCPSCGAHFDVRRAGVGIERQYEHLDPLPLLTRRGGVEVALQSSVRA